MRKFSVFSLYLIFTAAFCFSEQGIEYKRDFYAPVTEAEKANISHIVLTLANTSAFKLLFHKKSLEKSGASVKHLHPLKFLEVILTDPRLNASVGKIQGISWKSFSSGLQKSLNRAALRDNLKPLFVKEFSEKVGIPDNELQPLVQSRDWPRFVNLVTRH